MTVRAKFKVSSITYSEGSKDVLDETGTPKKDAKGYHVRVPCEMATIEMYPVGGNGDPQHENTKFWQSSPSGKFELGCVNKEASAQFEVGAAYYIDISRA